MVIKANKWQLILLAVLPLCSVRSAEPLIIYYRNTVSLNGEWKIIVDPYENGYYNYRWEPFDEQESWSGGYYEDKKPESPSDLVEYDFDKSGGLQVPGDWNTQNTKLYYYEGTVWYRKKFDAPATTGKRVFLYFGAVNYRADIYLNAHKLGVHVGGFTPFHFEITGLIKEKDNSLVVKVDNKRSKESVPTLNTDWWNYGGITRDVKLLVVPEAFVRDYSIQLESEETKKVSVKVSLENVLPKEHVTFSIPELGIKVKANARKNTGFSFQAKDAELWTPENPKLYRTEIAYGEDVLVDSVGFRTVSTRGQQILLNGKPVFLRGICIHEEYTPGGGGRVNEYREAEQLIDLAGELGCNFVRLAHYPHNEDMVRIAEKKGIMVWSEIPVYWTIDWNNEETFRNAKNQLTENILRDKNRANVIIWSLSNETPVNEVRTKFLIRLAKQARLLDETRLLSAAMEIHYKNDSLVVVEDPLAVIVDVVAFNEYIGWYDGLPSKCERINWKIPYDKPVFISEFGGGAKSEFHGDKDRRWTEEFQEDLYKKSLNMLDKIEGLSGMSPWILMDFRSPRRPLPGIQDDFNRKGLLSEKGEKKKAYSVLKQYYKLKQTTNSKCITSEN
ncbi:MAG: glycoside hydrolase family 2 TIM barrel-domain containing protein [Bacteroidales bacterium]|jgi:beta-glucuronidase